MRRAVLSAFLIALVIVAALAALVRVAEQGMAFFPFPGEDVTPARLGVRFEALEVQTADGPRLRAWWLPHEQPRAQVVYFHGNGGNLSIWSDILVEVHRRGYNVLAVDNRGYGLSTGSPSERGMYRDADARSCATLRPTGGRWSGSWPRWRQPSHLRHPPPCRTAHARDPSLLEAPMRSSPRGGDRVVPGGRPAGRVRNGAG